ncbi:MAG: ParB/RepB/Spo0J family partition protein [Chlamydiales bacterium]
MEEAIEIIDWDAIRVSPFQPRRRFSDQEIDQLAVSIRAVGLIHPPVVRKIVSGNKILYYELIAGERRWRAAKRAGLQKLSVIVREADDEYAAKSTLIENVQRVNLDPIEMAEAFQKLMTVFRMTQEEVAEKVGKKRSTIANYLRLLALPESIRKALSQGKISMGHAKAILSLDHPDPQNQLTKLIQEKQMTVRDAEEESARFTCKNHERSCSKGQKIENMERKLKVCFERKVEIIPSKRGGKMIFHYCSFDDLDHLYALLNLTDSECI